MQHGVQKIRMNAAGYHGKKNKKIFLFSLTQMA